MRFRVFAANVVLAGLFACLAINGCNNSSKGRAFFSTPTAQVGPLRIFMAASFDQQEQQEIFIAIQQRRLAFEQQIVPLIRFNYPGVGPTTAQRDVYVYDTPHLNAPWKLTVPGWTDIDKNFRINVVAGHCNIVPDLVHQLTHSYYFPYDIHDESSLVFGVPIWPSVTFIEDLVTDSLKVQRLCSHP